MNAKHEPTIPLNHMGAKTSAPVGILVAELPKPGVEETAESKHVAITTEQIEQVEYGQGKRMDLQSHVSHLLAEGDDTEDTLIRVCEVLQHAMNWDEVTFWPTNGHVGVPYSHRAGDVIAQAVAISTAHSQRPPTPLTSRLALIAHVFATGKPAQLTDNAASSKSPETTLPAVIGRPRSAFAFPVWGMTALLGVVECLSASLRSPRTAHLRELASVGVIIGRYIERQRAHEDAQPQPMHSSPEKQEAIPAETASRLHQLKVAFDALPDSVLILDREGNILHANAADRALLGYTRRSTHFTTSLQERERLLMVRDEYGQPLAADQSPFARILRGETLRGNHAMCLVVRAADSRDRVVNISGMPLVDAQDQLIGGVVITRDVTEQRRHEQSLEDSNRKMHEFLAVAAHDLKTPITASKAYVQLAARHLNKLEVAATMEAPALVNRIEFLRTDLSDAEKSAQRLTRLIDRLLDVAQIQANKLVLRPEAVDLAALVHTAVQEQRLATPTRAIRYKMRPLQVVQTMADPERFGEVLLNYLANAVKYSPRDSIVDVSLDVRDNAAWVAVRDRGMGIPPVEQERIWSRFEQLDDMQRGGSGTGLGLGLYISRAIIEAHGGHVGVESTTGRGSTFWFDVPLTPHTDALEANPIQA